jgi:hypothetical protein
MIRVFVITCDKYSWALKGFVQQFQKYWSSLQPVVIAGYTKPDYDLPDNFEFHSIRETEYGKNEWSNGLIDFLQKVNDEHFVLMLEDYWLCRRVDNEAVNSLHDLAKIQANILRIDLTDDRQYAGDRVDFNYLPYWGHNDLIWTPPTSPYQMSLQAGLWSRKNMLSVLNRNESAWQVEIGGTARNLAKRDDLWVLGTRQKPMRYANIFRGGDPENTNLTYLLDTDVQELKDTGALPK